MKRLAALILALCLALCAVGTAEAVQWRDYALNAVWLTSDPADINIPNLRTDGVFALIRMQPDAGTVAYETINTYAGDDMKLILSDGTEVPAASKGQAAADTFTRKRSLPVVDVCGTRKSLNMTQKSFADMLGVSRRTVEAWESGRTSPTPTAKKLIYLINEDNSLVQKLMEA